MYAMGKYQFLHGSMGMVHKSHQTPHIAVLLAAAIVFVAVPCVIPLGFLNAFGYTGTLASIGFVIVYLAMYICAPLDLKKTNEMKPWHVAMATVGVALMLFVIWGSVYPVPAYPYNVLPYLFLGYMIVGGVWFAILKAKSPLVLATHPARPGRLISLALPQQILPARDRKIPGSFFVRTYGRVHQKLPVFWRSANSGLSFSLHEACTK